ncbi:MAG: hypothetical protein NZ561_10840, partial [Phycisphaerae bacterium]|nr:hypothetical protein [Phycisphaerae bacterium]MDW8262683.1 hypothetical protein [Phycisphaerales bacterium]
GVVQSGWLEPARFVVTVVGTKGLVRYDYDVPTELLFQKAEGGSRVLPVESHEFRFDRQLAAFADRASGGPTGAQLPSFAEATEVAEVVDSALKSAIII